jgi:hypothetical protein
LKILSTKAYVCSAGTTLPFSCKALRIAELRLTLEIVPD